MITIVIISSLLIICNISKKYKRKLVKRKTMNGSLGISRIKEKEMDDGDLSAKNKKVTGKPEESLKVNKDNKQWAKWTKRAKRPDKAIRTTLKC